MPDERLSLVLYCPHKYSSTDVCRSLLLAVVVSDLTLRVSQDSAFLHTLGGLGSPSGPLPVLLFPLCCRLCGLTLEEADLDGDKADGEDEGDGGQVNGIFCPVEAH